MWVSLSFFGLSMNMLMLITGVTLSVAVIKHSSAKTAHQLRLCKGSNTKCICIDP